MKEAVINNVWQETELLSQQQLSPLFAINALQHWQRAALDDFLQKGFPDRFNEDWKYTRVAKIADSTFTLQNKAAVAMPVTIDFIIDAYRVVFVDGQFQPQLSLFPPDIIVTNILSLLQEPEWRDHLSVDKRYVTPFSQLNAALMTDGMVIIVPENYVLTKPIHFVYCHSAHEAALMCHPRHIICGKANSEFTVIEEYQGADNVYFNNVVTHLIALQGANITHYKIQDESKAAQHVALTLVTQSKDSSVFSYAISLGAGFSRDNLNFNLHQENSSCHLYGLYLPQGIQLIDHHTRVDHWVPGCFSQQNYKGVIAEKGHAVFNGKVYVHKGAQKTAAYQTNKNLLLDTDAEIDTKPELEIYADDVKCTHGATIGQVDENALFYLRSRGIDEVFARRLLLKGFSEEILKSVTEVNIAEYLQQKIIKQLEALS